MIVRQYNYLFLISIVLLGNGLAANAQPFPDIASSTGVDLESASFLRPVLMESEDNDSKDRETKDSDPGINPETESSPVPSSSPTPTASQVPSASPTLTPSPTVSIPPTPTPNSCPLLKIELNRISNNGNSAQDFEFDKKLEDDGLIPQCLIDKINEGNAACLARTKNLKAKYLDDCLAAYLTADPKHLPTFGLTDTAGWEPAYAVRRNAFGGLGAGHSYKEATIFIDNDCDSKSAKELSDDDQAKACLAGKLDWFGSPISLIWETGADVDQFVTTSKFPVNPGQTGKWQLWKASAKTPLLVFDPEHSGKITSSAQLFGQWTFGGKRFAMNNVGASDATSIIAESTWSNGFEALGSLDQNNDRELSGLELEPLSLWFDRNQDGVSQIGEVLSLSELNIRALFYAPDYTEAASRNIVATRGYSRLVDGKEVIGKAVDWFSDAADSQSTLIGRHLAQAALCKEVKNYKNKQLAPEKELLHGVKKTVDISGVWIWSIKDDVVGANGASRGIITIAEQTPTFFRGHSYIEAELKEEFKGAKKLVQMYSLTGMKEADAKGRVRVSFKIQTESGAILESEAELSTNGKRLLNGITKATVDYAGKPLSISYHWEAAKKI